MEHRVQCTDRRACVSTVMKECEKWPSDLRMRWMTQPVIGMTQMIITARGRVEICSESDGLSANDDVWYLRADASVKFSRRFSATKTPINRIMKGSEHAMRVTYDA